MTTSGKSRFVQIDEDGYLISEGLRVSDEEYGQALLENLSRDDRGRYFTHFDGVTAVVEAFDEPLIARSLDNLDGNWAIHTPYNFKASFDPHSLCLDEWDRFHGTTAKGVPFVFSRPAQASFFDLLQDYDDDSITIEGHQIHLPPWLLPNEEVNAGEFWTQIYVTEEPRWDLGEPAAALAHVLPQLKLPKQRVLCLGCGTGHDAAFLARQGHIVTGVDVSSEAISRARKLYGAIPNLQFLLHDLFHLPQNMSHSFDLIFEHTCYCAVNPNRRNELVQIWKRLLVPGGHILGVFFAVDRRSGPPWGGSEWEIRERLKKNFEFQYWTRWRHSLPQRLGMELVVFAQLKSSR